MTKQQIYHEILHTEWKCKELHNDLYYAILEEQKSQKEALHSLYIQYIQEVFKCSEDKAERVFDFLKLHDILSIAVVEELAGAME